MPHISPSDRWTVVGPCEYVPPVEVQVSSSLYLIAEHRLFAWLMQPRFCRLCFPVTAPTPACEAEQGHHDPTRGDGGHLRAQHQDGRRRGGHRADLTPRLRRGDNCGSFARLASERGDSSNSKCSLDDSKQKRSTKPWITAPTRWCQVGKKLQIPCWHES
mmetsp:Transcript_37617/g.100094  ORF Transcript_37617/g.100094 Transcript_37617/m.100094 type:complete len:160 (-) Transcript_37617:235-714(-)